MHPKHKMLKEVLRQMQCAMSEGEGDSEDVAKDAMAGLSGKEAGHLAESNEDGGGAEDGEDFADEKKD